MTEASCRAAIDRAYASLFTELPSALVTGAERLPRRLGLSSRGDVDWSEAFDDLPVLGLPTLVLGETTREVDQPICECAQRAHLFATIAARIGAGIDGGELEADEELDAILGAVERERNRALAELRLLGADRKLNFSQPEREVRAAFADEREVFEGRAQASFATYLTISTAKQSLAFLGISAAAAAAGFELEELGHLHELTLGSMLGIQIRNDVEAWLEDPKRASSWVRALSGEGRETIEVVIEMLELSRDAFGRAADSAHALGACSLMAWARAEANALRELGRIAERHLTPALAG